MNIKDLHKNLKNIPELVDTKGDILVIKNSRPAFKISSIRRNKSRNYSFDDIKKLQFSSLDKDMSQNLDKYIY